MEPQHPQSSPPSYSPNSSPSAKPPATKRARRNSKSARSSPQKEDPSESPKRVRESPTKEQASPLADNVSSNEPPKDTDAVKPQESESKELVEDSPDEDVDFDPDFEAYMRDKAAETTANMKRLLESMSEEQQNRFETFRSAAFPRAVIKRLLTSMLGQPVNEKMAVMVAGVAKLFVSQLVETARDVKEKTETEEGPLAPEHIRQANRILREQQSVRSSRFKGRFFM